jgi:hypothetical protein
LTLSPNLTLSAIHKSQTQIHESKTPPHTQNLLMEADRIDIIVSSWPLGYSSSAGNRNFRPGIPSLSRFSFPSSFVVSSRFVLQRILVYQFNFVIFGLISLILIPCVWKLISILVMWGLNLLIIYLILLNFIIFSLISVSLIPLVWKLISMSSFWGVKLLNFVIMGLISVRRISCSVKIS